MPRDMGRTMRSLPSDFRTAESVNDFSDFPHGPLTGLRVIEMGTLIAGPFCGQLMADFGAEVIKVEPPGKGDPMRVWGRSKDGKSLWWPVIARNKKSVTLDLRVAEGQSLLRELVAQADIVVENFRPGTLEGWGLGWDALSAINPRLIMVRMSGYGQNGPYAGHAGFGAIGEAMGRSEEHTSELQSLMRHSYAVFCLKKKTHTTR